MYLQFLSLLALGLLGLCLVLTILLDYVFVDWDLFEGFRNWLHKIAQHKRSYTIIQDIEEEGGAPRLVSRLIPERRHGQRHLEPSHMQDQASDEEALTVSSGSHGYWIGPKP